MGRQLTLSDRPIIHRLSLSLAKRLGIGLGLLAIASCSTPTQPNPSDVAVTPRATPPSTASSPTPAVQSTPEKSAPAKPDSPKPAQTTATAASPTAVAASPTASPDLKPDLKIDQTVCGQGGQAAYFETPKQKIYICRTENAALTYVGTPKKGQANSVFLPAQAIAQTPPLYQAKDGTRTYQVGSSGFRLEENGKAIAQEKITRQQ